MSAPDYRLGEVIVCPKCGKEGRIGLHVAYAKGYKYTYLAVLHPAVYGKKERKQSVRRCVLKQLSKEPAKPAAKQPVRTELEAELQRLREENERLREEVKGLKGEVEELRRRLAEAQAQAAHQVERVRAALAYLVDSRIASVGERERQALYLAAVARPSGKALPSWAKRLNVSVEEVKAMLEQGKWLLDLLTHSVFVAVKPEAWAQVEQLVSGWRA